MKYVYPRLSEQDLFAFRLGGAGLGNILFTYARAVVYARKNNCELIWPTWPSLKLGPILRREKDKRFYIGLFRNNSHYIGGIKKAGLLLTKKKVPENTPVGSVPDDSIVVFEGMDDCFLPIINDSKSVFDDIVENLSPNSKKALAFQASKAICVHIRLGDFAKATIEEVLSGKHCCAIPLEWYVNMINAVRRITGEDTKVYVFSDGTDSELTEVLSLPNVERAYFGNAIADILALSKAGVFIASGSSFSMWARYLGRMTTVMFPNQEKQKILTDDEVNKEITAIEDIPEEYHSLIKSILQ